MKSNRKNSLSVVRQRLNETRGNKNKYYTIPELAKLTGLTRRQIDYWAGIKLISASLKNSAVRGGGRPSSFFSTSEALKVLIFSDVKKRGFSLTQIKQLNRNFVLNEVKLDQAGSYLLTDGVTILYAKSDNEVIDILKNNRQMLLVPIQDQIERLKIVA